jgi:hypothetical protein
LNLTLTNVGYKFSKNLGVGAGWCGGAHVFTSGNLEQNVTYGTVMLGPFYEQTLSQTTSIHLKVRAGRFVLTEEFSGSVNNLIIKGNSRTASLSYSFGCSVQKNLTNWLVFTVATDYFHGKIESNSRVDPICLTAGLLVRW